MDEKNILEHAWTAVAALVEATLREDEPAAAEQLLPGSPAAQLLALFGLEVFDILLKTVLGQDQLELVQVVEVPEGLFIEFAWIMPGPAEAGRPVDGKVSVLLQLRHGRFLISDVNPAGLDLLLTEARARAILATSKILSRRDELPSEPWILPLALFAGFLPLPLRPEALADAVETRFFAGLQQREYGVMLLLRARRLWHDFKQANPLPTGSPALWAAAVEWVMGEQNSRPMPATAVAAAYDVSPAKLRKRAEVIQETLHITALDDRYTDPQIIDVLYQDEEG
ncbi:MAG: hypothetical protein KC441_08335 [Anaerolineales bacterium]|nr:hypothetical protein [Anaerolineales bacterium]